MTIVFVGVTEVDYAELVTAGGGGGVGVVVVGGVEVVGFGSVMCFPVFTSKRLPFTIRPGPRRFSFRFLFTSQPCWATVFGSRLEEHFTCVSFPVFFRFGWWSEW